MAKELYAGSLQGITGRYFEDAAFKVDKEESELYDQGYPSKQKEVTATQLFKD